MTDRYVVNNHGDHKSPKDRVVEPLPNGLYLSGKIFHGDLFVYRRVFQIRFPSWLKNLP